MKYRYSSALFHSRWHLFRHVGYLRHQQQVELWGATSVPILVFLGLSILELGPMYATDRRQTTASLNAFAPMLYRFSSIIQTTLTSCVRGDTICLRPCQWKISSYLFARWHLFPQIGYLRHQQQVDLWVFDKHTSDVRQTDWQTSDKSIA